MLPGLGGAASTAHCVCHRVSAAASAAGSGRPLRGSLAGRWALGRLCPAGGPAGIGQSPCGFLLGHWNRSSGSGSENEPFTV